MVANIYFNGFVWDSEKEDSNIKKHGISFKQAAKVFKDPRAIFIKDLRHSAFEIRWHCLGIVKGEVLTVRYTHRGNLIRILGAGHWRKGRKVYEKEKRQKKKS